MRASLMIFSLCLAGCGDVPPTLRLLITTSVAVPDDLDEVHVEIAAANQSQRTCEPRTGLFNLSSRDDLPVVVHIERGVEYTDSVSYRITGVRQDEPITADVVGWARWPDEGVQDISILIDSGCAYAALENPCLDGETCLDGDCIAANLPAAFVDPTRVDVGTTCWRDP